MESSVIFHSSFLVVLELELDLIGRDPWLRLIVVFWIDSKLNSWIKESQNENIENPVLSKEKQDSSLYLQLQFYIQGHRYLSTWLEKILDTLVMKIFPFGGVMKNGIIRTLKCPDIVGIESELEQPQSHNSDKDNKRQN